MSEIQVGDRAPKFTLKDQNGAEVDSEVELQKGPLVVFFYPKDETPGCTAEACSFRDATSDFMDAGATVLGISSDDVESHFKFATKHKLPYRLLADVGGKVRSAFGVPRAMFGLSDGRVTYVIDKGGIVRHRYEAMIRATKHVEEAIKVVKSLSH
jgi:peroxiredoxin Q/BCP